MTAKFIFLLFILIWFSCKKKDQHIIAPLPLLSKMVSTLAGETVTTTLEYSEGKVTSMLMSGTSAGKSVNTNTIFIRNAEGIIEKIIIRNPTYLTTFTSDSIVYTVHYSPSSNRYTSLINDLFYINGNTEYDSTYFTYDATGSIVQATKLIKDGSAASFKEGERNEFTYSGRNLIRCTNYILNSFYLEQSVDYDNKINPVALDRDGILLGSTRNNRRFEQSSFNNATVINYNQNGRTTSTIMSYTYNENNLPATRTNEVSTGSQTVTYFYQ